MMYSDVTATGAATGAGVTSPIGDASAAVPQIMAAATPSTVKILADFQVKILTRFLISLVSAQKRPWRYLCLCPLWSRAPYSAARSRPPRFGSTHAWPSASERSAAPNTSTDDAVLTAHEQPALSAF